MPDIYVAPSPDGRKSLPERKLNHFEKLVKDTVGKVNKSPLSAFMAAPENVSFETQADDEHIVLLLRQHWIINISWVLLIVLMILAPLCLSFFPLLSSFPARFRIVIIIMWYLFVLSILFEKFLWWFFNVFIVTDKRLVDIDFYSMVYKEISEAELEKIQDITFKSGGLLRTFFDFGTIFIQTAGKEAQIEFENVPQPAKVVKIISKLADQT